MTKLNRPITFETAFGFYIVDRVLGEGGAGRVFGGSGPDEVAVALKLLAEDRSSKDKRRRFKNEIAFLSQTRHANIVPLVDHGVSRLQGFGGAFYVMPLYAGSLRNLMEARIAPQNVPALFGQILDGVEAAHFHKVVHRDLKPENILYDKAAGTLAIADFGIAQFTDDIVATLVETAPSQRLANFQYAAPEQRRPGGAATQQTDIYALGLILNELFTGTVPHGTQFRQIGDIEKRFGFLDALVTRMLAQSATERPGSIAEVKVSIQRYEAEAVSLQRISQLDGTVIKVDAIDEPLAEEPPRLVGANWDKGRLTLTLDRPVTTPWVHALHNMGSYGLAIGKPPASFSFNGRQATVGAQEHEVQHIVDYFKSWLPKATETLKHSMQLEAQQNQRKRQEQLRREREEEERRLRVNQNIRI